MKTMADDKKNVSGGGAGGKAVEPAPPRAGFFSWITKAPEFFAQVRQEGAKVTWPTLAETRVTTIAVFIMIVMSIVFFALVDFGLSTIVKYVLSL
ncbi:MAG: preprotein translocase subunit SecE [Alphaproteobacteria bacterium]|nr:preprotein translocase subunit SecE [Alphaproteobacteria bacterium]